MASRRWPCLWCGAEFESRRSGRLCKVCAGQRNAAEREARKRELEEVIESLRPFLGEREMPSERAVKAALKRLRGSRLEDRQPPAWLNHWGSDDGESTYFSSVSLAIEESRRVLRADAEAQQWYEQNPHWTVGIPGTEKLVNRPVGVESCAGMKGSRRGYQAHKRDRTMACPECSEANRLYMKQYRTQGVTTE